MTKEERDQIYEALAEEALAEKFSLRRLDERFAEHTLGFVPKQKTEEGRMKFFTLYNRAHTERLSEEDQKSLEEWAAAGKTAPDADMERLLDMIERTWKQVLATRYSPQELTYMSRTLPEASSLPEEALIFRFSDTFPEGPADAIDWEAEKEKEAVFYVVKKQYEDLVRQKSDVPVCLMRG